MTITEIENRVVEIASQHLDIPGLTPETRLDSVFDDSLEYLDFTLRLGELGHLSEEGISHAETLGDLANAIIHTN